MNMLKATTTTTTIKKVIYLSLCYFSLAKIQIIYVFANSFARAGMVVGSVAIAWGWGGGGGGEIRFY